MLDIAKKVNKKNELLRTGENALAATALVKKGSDKTPMPAGVAVGAVTKSMADAFPPMNQSILALTNLRWILFEPASGGPKHEVASWTHDEIQGLDVDKGALMKRLTLTFADGSAVEAETPKAYRPGRFVEHAQKYCVAM